MGEQRQPRCHAGVLQRRKRDLGKDKKGVVVYLAESAWSLKMAQENHPDIQFHFLSEG
ncbi:MAG: hypothetical protein R2795_08255 [Saprospiraceae bacterium]